MRCGGCSRGGGNGCSGCRSVASAWERTDWSEPKTKWLPTGPSPRQMTQADAGGATWPPCSLQPSGHTSGSAATRTRNRTTSTAPIVERIRTHSNPAVRAKRSNMPKSLPRQKCPARMSQEEISNGCRSFKRPKINGFEVNLGEVGPDPRTCECPWTICPFEGAEAVLRRRSIYASGDFDDYWRFHEQHARIRNHVSRFLLTVYATLRYAC